MTDSWLNERPEPIVQQAMETEAGIARREAAFDPHPLDCICCSCVEPDMDLLLDPLRDFSAEDDKW